MKYLIGLALALIVMDSWVFLALANVAGWPLMLAEVVVTATCGLLAVRWLPRYWGDRWIDPHQSGWTQQEGGPGVFGDAVRLSLLLAAALCLVLPGPISDIVGVGILVYLVAVSFWRRR
jgi:UPF0716 family protein affecting phage T7 exclusion